MILSDDQSNVVKHFQAWSGKFYWMAGYAGTGKTTIVPYLVENYRNPVFVAPTNKAAKVLSGKLGRAVTSIHKAIYYPPSERQGGELGWSIREDALRGHDLIVCDEASMVGERLGSDLASFDIPILAIGDPGQLPPVQDVPYFCAGKPDSILTRIHRQAEGNPIIALSRDIREGKRLSIGTMGDAVNIARAGEVNIDFDNLPQIITGTHKRRWRITDIIRDNLEREAWLPYPGEPLICRKNSIARDLINGQECIAGEFSEAAEAAQLDATVDGMECKAWRGPFKELTMSQKMRPRQFDDDWTAQRDNGVEQFDFAYAVTCHSAQGSQWPDVLVYDESGVFRKDAVKWLYTAVTRAADRLTVII